MKSDSYSEAVMVIDDKTIDKMTEGDVGSNVRLAGWVENESDYLRSSMSYTNSRNLDEHKESRWVVEMSVAYNQ